METPLRKFVAAAAAIAALSFVNSANAADMAVKAPIYKAPVAVPFSWTGWYVGLQGGYSWGRSQLTQGTAATNWFDVKGGFIGGTLGANWQFQNIVLGIETDAAWSDIKSGPQPSSATFGCGSGPCETNVTWFGTTRGRLGLAWDRFLVYGTGGVAYGFVHSRIDNTAPLFDDGGKTRVGWTAGGGVEYAFTNNWSAKVEYLHIDFGTYDIGTSVPTPQAQTHLDLVRGGLNYRFNWP